MPRPVPGDTSVKPWDSDHTALVHVLWAAEREGLTLADIDRLAAFIMQSQWFAAVRIHAMTRHQRPLSS